MGNLIMENDIEYLYHYTSIESLALILKNRTIRLNALNKMDDLQEQKTQDVLNFGQFFFVSSWTDEDKESIPMWKMYTSTSSGVRIKLRKNPFKRQKTKLSEFAKNIKARSVNVVTEQAEIDTLLDLGELIKKKVFSIDAWQGNILKEVIYTNDKEFLEPKIKSEDGMQLLYDKIGKYKDLHWKFQKEWRYLMKFIPLDMLGSPSDILLKFQILGAKILEGTETMPFSYIDLEIEKEYFEEMEITPSPQMSVGYKIVLDSLLEKYNPKAIIKESELIGLI